MQALPVGLDQMFVVGDLKHEFGHNRTEMFLEFCWRDTDILYRIVQQSGHHQFGVEIRQQAGQHMRDLNQMINVRFVARTLTPLPTMPLGGELRRGHDVADCFLIR